MGYELCQKIIDLIGSLGYGVSLCFRVWLNFYCKINSIILSPKPDKPEITNYKHQNTNKFQITISKSQTRSKLIVWSAAGGSVIVIYLVFVI